MKIHLAEDEQSVTFLIRRDEFEIAIQLLAMVGSPNPVSAQKIVGLYNKLVELAMADAEAQLDNNKPTLTVIPGGKDDDTIH